MPRWTKKAAVARMESNPLLQEILEIEPRLRPIVQAAKRQRNVKGYNRITTYIELRSRAAHLVGWHAENEVLRTCRHYDTVVIDTIVDLLPPDAIDLARL